MVSAEKFGGPAASGIWPSLRVDGRLARFPGAERRRGRERERDLCPVNAGWLVEEGRAAGSVYYYIGVVPIRRRGSPNGNKKQK